MLQYVHPCCWPLRLYSFLDMQNLQRHRQTDTETAETHKRIFSFVTPVASFVPVSLRGQSLSVRLDVSAGIMNMGVEMATLSGIKG